MSHNYITIIVLLGFLVVKGQQLNFETDLDSTVDETSGLIYLNNTLITHNDSGNTNQLFDIDRSTGNVSRTVTIDNATNIDWEDITHDNTYIYIGDFGNFQGDRTDLKVYRILISDYFNSTSVTADIISFSYTNQTDFTPSPLATNFDAEALVHYNNKLYIFTKNWLDGKSNIYELGKTPGTYSISVIDSIDAQGLITGAAYNNTEDELILCGYDATNPFLFELNNFNSGLFSNGNQLKTYVSVPQNYSIQIEGITHVTANEYLISAEENAPDNSGLFSINLETLSNEEYDENSIEFYPNPANNFITINQENCSTKIYSILGELIISSTDNTINLSQLDSGVYLIKIRNKGIGSGVTKRLVIN